jgi:hypothetical protein
MHKKAFGSGHFGEWIVDEWGLPAYRYTCDQTRDPAAVTVTHQAWRSPVDHSHQVGNDRLVAVASNFGYVLVRQDEGAPKYLNDYDPENRRFGGGFGYLTDGSSVLSTFYPGGAKTFERTFGMGYLRKEAHGAGYGVDQIVFAPFGDDPLLISQVTVTNRREAPADLRWIEYWDCQPYPFSFRASILAMISYGKKHTVELRRAFARRYAHTFKEIEDHAGLLDEKHFRGEDFATRVQWAAARAVMATVGRRLVAHPVKRWVKEMSFEDISPPDTFLVSLDAPADGLAVDEQAFFGQGGVQRPDGLGLPVALENSGEGSALFLERRFSLPPGETQTLAFAFGYLPPGYELESLIARYQRELPGLFARSCAAWKADRLGLEIPGEPWVDRELHWHHYALRSNLTYDTFFQEHILSQGHVYQYLMGFQGAARDPLQHALPFTFTRPEIVKQILRYTLKEVLPDGEIPYGITGHGMIMPAPFRPSDQELWLLWLAGEYVLATRDAGFLDEVIPLYPVYGPRARKLKVKEALALCYRHLVQINGTGKHGLLRLSNGDWNDISVFGYVPKGREEQVRQQGESVLNAAFAAYALELYARMLAYAGDHALAAEASRFAAGQCEAVREQWAGRYFRRMWLSEDLGWVGEDVLWLEPQPWAILSGAATPEQTRTLVEALNELVRDPNPTGAMLLSQGSESMIGGIGVGTNAGVWPSINGTLVWALASVDGRLGWDEWRKNSLAFHAEHYPNVWYGIWSGPDTYNSALSAYPGHTIFHYWADPNKPGDNSPLTDTYWTDFPVMNMHLHAWPLYDTVKLLGVEFDGEGVRLAPSLPLPEYRFRSPLLGLEKGPHGYSGWYAPARAGVWRILLQLPAGEVKRFTRLRVNGVEQEIAAEEGAIVFSGESAPGRGLRWEISTGECSRG